MTRVIVRWWPPYTNGYKDQPCSSELEAHKMKSWFRSVGVNADVVLIVEIEQIVGDI